MRWRKYHLATCTLQASDAETNSIVAENHNCHSTTMSAWAAVNKYNPISYFCISAALLTTLTKLPISKTDLALLNSERHWNCTAHFRYRGSIEYRDTREGIVIVAPISGIAQHYCQCNVGRLPANEDTDSESYATAAASASTTDSAACDAGRRPAVDVASSAAGPWRVARLPGQALWRSVLQRRRQSPWQTTPSAWVLSLQ